MRVMFEDEYNEFVHNYPSSDPNSSIKNLKVKIDGDQVYIKVVTYGNVQTTQTLHRSQILYIVYI